MKQVNQRSLFNKSSVQQYVTACSDPAVLFKPHEDLETLIRKRSKICMATQVNEDSISAMKNNRKIMSGKRYRKPEWSMSAALISPLLDQRHKYRMSKADRAVSGKSARMPPEAFRAPTEDRSLDFSVIEGTTSTAGWYSPSHGNYMVPSVDLEMKRSCKAMGSLNLAADCWQGALVDGNLDMLITLDGPAHADTWFMPLHAFHDSSV